MPKILQINTTCNCGSTGRIAEEIGLKAQEHNWDSFIGYGRYPRESNSLLLKIGNSFDVYLHGLQSRIFDNHGLASTLSTNIFLKKLRYIKPDIIHLHNIHGYYINYKLLFNFLNKISVPVVWTFHDCWPYTGHCTHYSNINCSLWKTSCGKCPQKKEYPSSLFYDRSELNYLDKKNFFTSLNNLTIVAVSDWLKNEISQSFFNTYPVYRIHNGLDIDIFSPKGNNKDKYRVNNKFMILSVASYWNEHKGLSDFYELASVLKNDEIIVLVGLTDKQISSLPPNIIGLKKTESLDSLVELYSSADLYISFSVEETFGLTIAESLSCGTPALVYDSTACPEIISETTGFKVKPHNIKEVRFMIDNIRNIPHDFATHCRKRAIDLFNKNDRWDDYIKLYQNLI